MFILEFMKASCLWEMKDEIEREPIKLWRTVESWLDLNVFFHSAKKKHLFTDEVLVSVVSVSVLVLV